MKRGLLRKLDDRALPLLIRLTERAGRRGLVLGALALCLVATLIVGGVAGGPRSVDGDAPSRSVTKVGPVAGTLIDGYIATTRRDLAALIRPGARPVYAMVSLSGYGTPAQVAVLSNGFAVAKAFFRVPLPGVQTEIRSVDVSRVRHDLEAQMRLAADRAEAGARAAQAQADQLTGSSTREKQLRAFYRDSARLLRSQARAYRSLCACVYAFVVTATPQDLSALAQRAGVRAVDPAAEISALDRAVFLPLLPEQRVVVAPPADTGVAPLPATSETPAK